MSISDVRAIDFVNARILDNAFLAHPERFTCGRPRPLAPPTKVWINPLKEIITTTNYAL